MKYIVAYDPMFDEVFQVEMAQIPANMPQECVAQNVSDTPWPNLPIMSRYRSERHPGWEG